MTRTFRIGHGFLVSNAAGQVTKLAFVAPDTDSPASASNGKPVARPRPHIEIPRVDSPPAKDSSRFRCAKRSCRGSSLIRHHHALSW